MVREDRQAFPNNGNYAVRLYEYDGDHRILKESSYDVLGNLLLEEEYVYVSGEMSYKVQRSDSEVSYYDAKGNAISAPPH
ncbi:MAG: hypothetical protein IKE58_06335 [Blautia sp.]|nr:hypothetical protein [Blautia sp.]